MFQSISSKRREGNLETSNKKTIVSFFRKKILNPAREQVKILKPGERRASASQVAKICTPKIENFVHISKYTENKGLVSINSAKGSRSVYPCQEETNLKGNTIPEGKD